MRLYFISILGIFLLLGDNNAHAQLLDSIRNSFKVQPALYGKLDNRISFINTRPVSISGIKIGLNYGKTTYVGIGYNWLQSDLTKSILIEEGDQKGTIVSGKFSLWSVSPFIEYVFFKSRKWNASIPVQLEIGNTYYKYNLSGDSFRSSGKLFVAYEPAMVAEYKLLPFFSLSAGIGFRLGYISKPHRIPGFNAPIVLTRIKLDFNYLYGLIKKD